MYSFECDFFPADLEGDIDRFVETTLGCFLAALSRHGYVIDREWNLVEIDDRLRLFCLGPTEDALETAYHNLQASVEVRQLIEQSRRSPTFRLVGPALGAPECCSCESPSSYILFTTFIATAPPVRCGDCHLPVPLYRLPMLEGDQDHGSLRNWGANYQACDSLFMGSSVGERWGYGQVSDVDSELTREGRAVCEAMAGRMGRPWYYFLNRYEEEQQKSCPGCGASWDLDEPFHDRYDYKCDRCCLLSVEPGCFMLRTGRLVDR